MEIRFTGRLGLLGVSLVLTLASSGVTGITDARPAQAAGCFAESCVGKWPGEQGCVTTLRVVAEHPVRFDIDAEGGVDDFVGNGKLFYSLTCRASFVEFTMSKWDDEGAEKFPYFQFWHQDKYGGRRKAATFTLFQASPMIFRSTLADWNSSVQMCAFLAYAGQVPDPDDPDWGAETECTPWL